MSTTSVYNIVKSLQSASGNIEKQAILDANKDNELFRAYMKAVYDVGINYYQKTVKKPERFGVGTQEFGMEDVQYITGEEVAGRKYTGHIAADRLAGWVSALNDEGRELVKYILDRKIGASVGDSMVLKTWPDLYFLPPYQRCSLLDAKARERFGKLKRFYVQTKADGSFAYVVKRLDGAVDVITRQGSKYPVGFTENLLLEYIEPGTVLVGELMVGWWKQCDNGLPVDEAYYNGSGFRSAELEMYDRKTANGILNSVLKGGDLETHQYIVMQAWDLLLEEEFVAGHSTRTYEDRFNYLVEELPHEDECHPITPIFTEEVGSLEEAFVIYQEHLQRGLEGVIISDPDDLWKDGTSKGKVKLKIKFQVEMRVKRLYEGTGKAAGKLGGAELESEDGGIENDCGSGFDDKQRELFWNQPELLLNQIVMVEANDITTSRDGKKKPALSLPIFCEVRYDKVVADTTERIYAQLEAAKFGGSTN